MSNELPTREAPAVEPVEKRARVESLETQFFDACKSGDRDAVQDLYEKEKDHLEAEVIQSGFAFAISSDERSAADYLWDKVSLEFKMSFFFDTLGEKHSNFYWRKFSSNEKNEAFIHACKTSHRKFLGLQADHISKNDGLLSRVFEFSDVSCVRVFVEKFKLNINKPTAHFGMTLFHFACTNPDVRVVRYLCEQKNADAQDGLLTACAKGSQGVVEYLHKEKKADPKASGFIRHRKLIETAITVQATSTPLEEATREGNLAVVQYLVDECSVGFSPYTLTLALSCGREDVAEYYCKKMGPGIYGSDPETGCNALHIAVLFGCKSVVAYLCRIMDDGGIHARTKNGSHAFHLACEGGNVEIVKSLYDRITRPTLSFDFQMIRGDGKTPLQLACEKGHFKVAQFLFEKLYNKLDLENLFIINNPAAPVRSVGQFTIAQKVTCHQTVEPRYTLFQLLQRLRKTNNNNADLICLVILIQKDIQLFDSVLLRNVFCGSPETEHVYQLNEDQKNRLIRCILMFPPEKQPELRRDVWSRFVLTCFDAFNNPQNGDEAKTRALHCAVLFLDALMRNYPENNSEYETQLTVVLKFLLGKAENQELLVSMAQNYSTEMKKLIDDISNYFIQHKVIASRILSKLHDSCTSFQLARTQAANIPLAERIVELEKEVEKLKEENARLRAAETRSHVQFMLQGNNEAAPNDKPAAERDKHSHGLGK